MSKLSSRINGLVVPALAMLLTSAVHAQTTTTPNNLSFSTGAVTFNTPSSGPNFQFVNVTSSNGPVAFTTSVFPAASWLTVDPPAGTTTQTLQIRVNPSGLATGTYATFLTATTGSSTATLPIVLNVGGGDGQIPVTVSPGSLSFTFPTGSTTAQTKLFNVSSNAGPLSNVAVTPITSASGNWLTVSPTSLVIAPGTPSPVNVSVNPSLLTSAGVYHALVAVAPPGTTGAVVPVTVTVASPTAVNANPQQLSFFYQTGTSNPAPQTLNVTSVSGLPVAYTAAAVTTSCGNGWLIVSPQSSATPTPLSVQINASGLQPGTCAGQITVTAPGSATPTQTIPVSLIVTNNPLLQVPTAGPTFTYLLNSNTQIPAQNIQVTSSGSAIPFTVTTTPVNSGPNFLTVTPSSASTPGPIAIGVNQQLLATLAPGTYIQNVTITAAGAGNSPQTFPVTLVVSNNPILSASQPSVTFNYQVGQSTPPSQVITLNSTGTPLAYTVTSDSGNCANFLSVTPESGMTLGAPGQTGQIVVSANTTGITTATTCTGSITLSVPNSSNPPVVIPVVLNAATVPIISPSLPAINVTALVGTTNITQQIVGLTSTNGTGTVSFNATATTSPQGLSWLAVTPNSGSTPTNLTVIINPANLQPGTYTGRIDITSTTANVPAQSIPVTLNVVSAFTTVSPASLAFSQPLGGQAPASQSFTITNVPAGTTIAATSTTLTGGAGWLTASVGSNGAVSVAVNGAGLQQGVYQGVVTVIAPGTSPNPTYIPVTFTVGSPQTLTFSTPGVGFNFQAGSSTLPGAQQIQVNTNGNNVPITVAFTPDTGGQFVTVTPTTGTTPGPISIALNQSVVSTLTPGSYSGRLTVSSSAIPNGAQTIPITLVVAPQGPPIVISIVNAASNLPGAVAAGEIVTIYGNGIGPSTPYFLKLTASGSVETSAGDLTVTFDGVRAPITFANSTQINAIVPYEIAGHATTSLVVNRGGQSSIPISLRVADAVPAIFSLTQTGSGQGAILNQNNTVNGLEGAAPKGSIVVIYGTGEGALKTGGTTGSVTGLTSPFPVPAGDVSVTIGGIPAEIVYAGEAPGLVSGVLQVNARIPQNAPSGNQPIVLKVGGATSVSTITVAVQ